MKRLFWSPAALALLAAGCQPSASDPMPESGASATASGEVVAGASETPPASETAPEPPAPSAISEPPETAAPKAGQPKAQRPKKEPAHNEPAVNAEIVDADCGADKVRAYVGKEATPALRAEVAAKSGAKSIRWLTPDAMITMDLRHDRLNAHLGMNGKIGSFRCG